MFARAALFLFVVFANAVIAAEYHPCLKAIEVRKTLSDCASKTAYCSKVEGHKPTFTRVETTTTYVPASTSTTYSFLSTTTTSTLFSTTLTTTRTVTSTATSITSTSTATTFTVANSCGGQLRKRAFPTNPGGCGIPRSVDAENIAAACDCLLAVDKTVTATVYTGVASTETLRRLRTVTTKITTASTSTTTTVTTSTTTTSGVVTTTLCTTPFHIKSNGPPAAGDFLACTDKSNESGTQVGFDDDGNGLGSIPGADTRTFYHHPVTGEIWTTSGNVRIGFFGSDGVVSLGKDRPTTGGNFRPMICQINSNGLINCGVNFQVVEFNTGVWYLYHDASFSNPSPIALTLSADPATI